MEGSYEFIILGDHDAILTLLLVPRMLLKCDILLSYVRDKFPAVDRIHRAAVTNEYAVIQYSFGSKISYHLNYLQVTITNSCNGGSYSLEVIRTTVRRYLIPAGCGTVALSQLIFVFFQN